jgi:hypothetical protein
VAEAPDPASPYASAADKLRETTKWLFTGIVATAGAVFAGSSLTNLGSLEPGCRLYLAGVGLLVGFCGMGFLARSALSVLTINLGTPRMIAERDEFAATRVEIDEIFSGSWPLPARNYASFVALVSLEFKKPGADPADPSLLRAAALMGEVANAAAFLIVRAQFLRLVRYMGWHTLLMIAGFGMFAWAANPPDKPATPERGIVFKVTY